MQRGEIGDVYAFKTERGYRIMQWSHTIEKYGKIQRVFPGFYSEKPNNLEEIVKGDCAYMVNFHAALVYRKGVFELWGNYPPSTDLPTHSILPVKYLTGNIAYSIREFIQTDTKSSESYIGDASGSCIPEKYKDVRMLKAIPYPIYFLYMLEADFDLKHFDRYWPKDDELEKISIQYADRLFGKTST